MESGSVPEPVVIQVRGVSGTLTSQEKMPGNASRQQDDHCRATGPPWRMPGWCCETGTSGGVSRLSAQLRLRRWLLQGAPAFREVLAQSIHALRRDLRAAQIKLLQVLQAAERAEALVGDGARGQ